MKKIILIAIALGFLNRGFSQTYTQGVDAKLQLLNKTEITTNILYDRVYPVADLVHFNQTQADTSRAEHLYHAYAELQTADYLSRWNPLTTLQDQVAAEVALNQIPIGLLNVDFQHLDELAFQDNLVAIQGADSLLADVPGRARSPYLPKTALVVSPLSGHTTSLTATFVTGPAYTLQAAGVPVATLEADFGDGLGWQPLPAAGTLNVNFPAPGLRHIAFKITLSNGAVKYTHAALRVYAAPPVAAKGALQQKTALNTCTAGTLVATRTFQGPGEDQPYNAIADYQVYTGGGVFDKPVIVLEGFDPLEGNGDDGNNIYDIYNFLNYDNGADNLGFDLRFTHGGFDMVVVNFLKYQVGGIPEAFGGKTINGGTDYIERNAMVLIDLIEQVNSCKVGANPIKIIGFSMGGLIARYALRYMELNGIPHNADLFVSVDSPHQGAVVPMGIQEFADLMDDIIPFGLANKADDVLHTPAAKQMLIRHVAATPNMPHSYHEQFYATLNAMGMPQQTRNIAVVNGVADGTPINAPGQKYAHTNGSIDFVGVGVKAKGKLHYAPDRGINAEIMTFKLKLKLLLAELTVFSRDRAATTPAATGSYENTPGGFFNVTNLVHDFLGHEAAGDTDLAYISFYLGSLFSASAVLQNPNFSFIPVKSALAYTGANADLYEDFSSRDLVCSGETLFDSYYIPPVNQQHIALTSASAHFITQEILGNQQPPPVSIASDAIISGPSVVCNSNAVFTVPSCSVNNVSWSVSPNLQVVATTPTSLTVKALDNTVKGAGSISVSFGGQQAQPKQIYVGKPKTPVGSITGPTTISGGFLVDYFGVPAEGATSYQWKVPYPYTTGGELNIADPNWNIRSTAGYMSVKAFTGTQANAGLVQLMGENACGCGGAITLQVNVSNGGPKSGLPSAPQGGIPKMNGDPGSLISDPNDSPTQELKDIYVYPNPASKEVHILLNEFLSQQHTQLTTIRLYDTSGKLVKQYTPEANETELVLDIALLPQGFYNLSVDVAGKAYTKKLWVE